MCLAQIMCLSVATVSQNGKEMEEAGEQTGSCRSTEKLRYREKCDTFVSEKILSVVHSSLKKIVSSCSWRAFLLWVERGRGRSEWTLCIVFHVLLYSVKFKRVREIQGLLNSPSNISVLDHWKLPLCVFSLCVHVLLLMVYKMLQRMLE